MRPRVRLEIEWSMSEDMRFIYAEARMLYLHINTDIVLLRYSGAADLTAFIWAFEPPPLGWTRRSSGQTARIPQS